VLLNPSCYGQTGEERTSTDRVDSRFEFFNGQYDLDGTWRYWILSWAVRLPLVPASS
jgi:hypothetical protein